jgi:hypothetical protein
MRIKLTAKGFVSDGRLHLPKQDRENLKNNLRELEGKRVEVVVQLERRNKSTKVRGYYWSVVVPFAMAALIDAGYDSNITEKDAHELLKYWFNRKCIRNEETGEVIEYPASTESNTPEEDAAYIERIAHFFASEFGAIMPEPNSGVSYRFSGESP